MINTTTKVQLIDFILNKDMRWGIKVLKKQGFLGIGIGYENICKKKKGVSLDDNALGMIMVTTSEIANLDGGLWNHGVVNLHGQTTSLKFKENDIIYLEYLKEE